MKVSIVIPIYNQEEYLEKALSDALNQTYEDVEVVAVNDGSTDSSAKILQYFINDAKLKVINKKNGGLVSANVAGIRASTGDYVCFFDPDDRIGPDFVSSFVRELDMKYDFVAKGFWNKFNGELSALPLKQNHEFSQEELRNLTNHFLLTPWLSTDYTIYVTRWNKIYRRAILLDFVDEYAACGHISLCEDVIFNYLLLQHASNGKSCVEPNSYQYIVHENSMSHLCCYETSVRELDKSFDVFKKIIARYTKDLTPALLPYYIGLYCQLGMAFARGDSAALSVYSSLQNNNRFKKAAACAVRFSGPVLSVETIKARLFNLGVPFWLYRLVRNLYRRIKLMKNC